MSMKKYDQIVRKIHDYICRDVLKDGDHLPSVRAMAKQTGVSIMTVLEGYRRLENMGLIESRPQSGFYVRPKALRHLTERLPEITQPDFALRTESVRIPEAVQRLVAQALRQDVLPLGSSLPDPIFFPSEELSIHLARIARTYPEVVNQSYIGMGHQDLLTIIIKLMIEVGIITQKDEVVITNGETQALMLALKAVARPGNTVAVESPGYNGFYNLLQFLSFKAVEIPSDPQNGLDANALQTILHNGLSPACVILSSNFSNPTGALIPDQNKERIVKLCSQYNLPIIEDDTYGGLTFSASRPHPLKTLAPDSVIYIGNFSKILAPGYGVAWLAGGRYADDIRRCYAMSVTATPVINQLALASFLKGGGLKRHLQRLRKQYEGNARLLQSAVARSFPDGTRACNPQGGQFLWVELPPDFDSVALSSSAINDKISIAPGVLFSSRQYYRRNFRLNCAIKWTATVEKAIERLGELAACSRS